MRGLTTGNENLAGVTTMTKLKITAVLALALLLSGCIRTGYFTLDGTKYRLTEDERRGIFTVVDRSTDKVIEERQGQPGPLWTRIEEKGSGHFPGGDTIEGSLSQPDGGGGDGF